MLRDDNNFIKSVIDSYSDTIYRICLVYLKNRLDAEDAYQEIFIKIIEKAPNFNNDNHQKGWLITVTINHCKNLLKKKKYHHTLLLDENLISNKENKENKEILQTIFNLPLNYRNVIYLYYYEGYSTKEISNILQAKESTIRTWLKRARENLKIMLGGVINEQDL